MPIKEDSSNFKGLFLKISDEHPHHIAMEREGLKTQTKEFG